MAKVKNYKCYEYQVNSVPVREGQIIYTTDTGKIFLDIDVNTRIQVNSIYKIVENEMTTINPITNGIYYLTDKNMLYFYDGTQWIGFGSKDDKGQTISSTYIKDIQNVGEDIVYTKGDGTTGTVGFKGKDGSSIWTTTTAPSTSGTVYTFTTSNLSGSTNAPKIGDIILYSYYRYTVTSVTDTTAVCSNTRVSIRGATGTRGSLIYTGTAITGTSTTGTIFSGSGITSALVNDVYINQETGNMYKCTTAGAASTAKWTYAGSIKGVKGDKGDKGDQGDPGDIIRIGESWASSTEKRIFFKSV